MRNSKKFDNVLNECLEQTLFKGESVEQCLQSFPAHADRLKPLLEVALAIQKASAIQPDPGLKDKARYQLYSALRETEYKKRLFLNWKWQPQWSVSLAIVLVLLLAGSGTVAAASGSMPDEPLYPVKLATEQAQLVFTPSALSKAELCAKLADRRVAEIVRMADESKPEQIERTAHRLDIYLTRIADLASVGQVPEAPTMVLPSAEDHSVRKVPFLPPGATGAPPMIPGFANNQTIGKAPLPFPGIRENPVVALSGGEEPVVGKATLPPEQGRIGFDRRAKLRGMVVNGAQEHPQRMRAILEKVPPSARPALLRAIAIAESDYEKALKSLD